MREPYQMDLLDLDDREYQPITNSNPFMAAKMYYCPKCDDLVGFYSKAGKDKGWHNVKEICRNGHRLTWKGIKE